MHCPNMSTISNLFPLTVLMSSLPLFLLLFCITFECSVWWDAENKNKRGCWEGCPCTAALISQRVSVNASESLSNVKQCVGGGLSYQCVSRLTSWVKDPAAIRPCTLNASSRLKVFASFFLSSTHPLSSPSALFLIFFGGRGALELASLRMKRWQLQSRCVFVGIYCTLMCRLCPGMDAKPTLLCPGVQVKNSSPSHSKEACLYAGLHINNAGKLGFPAVLLACSL